MKHPKPGFLVSFEFDLNPQGVDSAKKISRKRLGKPKKISRRLGRRHCFQYSLTDLLFLPHVYFI